MPKLKEFPENAAELLNEIGGEDLAESGFEAENAEPDFESSELIDTESNDSEEE